MSRCPFPELCPPCPPVPQDLSSALLGIVGLLFFALDCDGSRDLGCVCASSPKCQPPSRRTNRNAHVTRAPAV
uniref:Uncharacterized protein n=1 Tax=Anguilla anguilla TaxID=7936 RepID=A0A0E9VRZ6_ANGAN